MRLSWSRVRRKPPSGQPRGILFVNAGNPADEGIASGDSDFSPRVSKLRENAKVVIGVGVQSSTSDLVARILTKDRRQNAQTRVDPGWPASPSPQAGLRPVEGSGEVGQEMRAVARSQQIHG
jgi:hypothetical protein